MSVTPESSTQPRAAADIQEWIQTKMAAELQTSLSDIDVTQQFVSFGIDSIAIFTLTGDLAEWLGRDLRATLLWEYPNIQELSKFLAEEPDTTGSTSA